MAPNPKKSGKLQRKEQDEGEHKGRKGLKMNQWREDQMKAAIEEYKEQVESGRPALRLLARKWNVPKTTLQRRVKGLVVGSEHASGRKPFIPVESEQELVRLLTLLSQRGFPMRRTDVQSLAFEFAKINGIRGFSEEKQKAGYHWYEGFIKRNPGLKIKKPGAISPATRMNEVELSKWFKTKMAPNPKKSGKLQKKQQDEGEHKGRKGLKMNQWREDQMKAAIEEYKEQVESGRPALRLLARKWNVPKTTLQRRVKGLVVGSEHASGRKPFIPVESEQELVRLLTLLSQRGFQLRRTDVQSLAFEFAKINGIRGFSEEKQKAGYSWYEGFIKRNPGLKIKKPGAISSATTMNEEELGKWFKMYEITLDALGIKDVPSHIWKCDLSELQDNFSSMQYVGEGEEPCFQNRADEEEETPNTVLAAFNASGTFAPPLIILKENGVRNERLKESMENVCIRTLNNGWITAELFVEWGEMFVAQLPKEDARPHLLLLDDQSSQVFNLGFFNLMNQNNVEVMCYRAPQLENRALFRSLKHNWCEVSRKWNQQCAGMKLPRAHYCSVFTEAWKTTATVERAQDGFRTTGMFPLNELAFIEHEPHPANLSRLENNTPPIEDAAHCSTESGSGEPSAVEVTSFKDFVVIQKFSKGTKTPGAKTIPHFHRDTKHILYNEHLKQKPFKPTSCRGCLIKHGADEDPKASEAWIRCSNCKACYHESCVDEDGIYEWVYDVDGDDQ
ncbi:uncharacterized protein LOC143744426 [Siphateles boraxobius]|uniref:uncharacterized protein LOC143744426 n=1 Tax=Siphateles boraxobius TaxID=180520 RepID=UPI00406361DB